MTPGEADAAALAAHEALCQRCGVSCHFAFDVDDRAYVIPDLRCRFLEREPGGRFACAVYAERFARASWCAAVPEAIDGGLLRQGCPYVAAAGIPDDRGKAWLPAALETAVLPILRAALIEDGAPLGASEVGLRAFLERTGGGVFRFEADEAEETLWIVRDP